MDNYFEFYGLEVKFHPDTDEIRSKYLEISKSSHPDFFIDQEEEHERALEISSVNNKAFKTLSDESLRTQHILEINGVLAEKKELPGEFLMEMMDLNEGIMDMKMSGEGGELMLARLHHFEAELSTSYKTLSEQYDAHADRGILEQIHLNYLKQKYLNRLKEHLDA